MKCFIAMKRWVERDGLAGIAVGCYPDLMGEVCLACGLLAEEDIITSCEGDMNSLILTYMMHHIGSQRPCTTQICWMSTKLTGHVF